MTASAHQGQRLEQVLGGSLMWIEAHCFLKRGHGGAPWGSTSPASACPRGPELWPGIPQLMPEG